tara:strand:+ start:6787 stop:7152 length:366 start_codon:yes stop_codon:yes gene_type:complete
MHFGRHLLRRRLKAGYGLQHFAKQLNIPPSKLSDIERGFIPMPRDADVLTNLRECLGEDDYKFLVKEMRKPFKMQKKHAGVPIVFKPLPEGKYDALVDYLKEDAKKHNKKADEFNAKNEEE